MTETSPFGVGRYRLRDSERIRGGERSSVALQKTPVVQGCQTYILFRSLGIGSLRFVLNFVIRISDFCRKELRTVKRPNFFSFFAGSSP